MKLRIEAIVQVCYRQILDLALVTRKLVTLCGLSYSPNFILHETYGKYVFPLSFPESTILCPENLQSERNHRRSIDRFAVGLRA